jgi:hypothetical protein
VGSASPLHSEQNDRFQCCVPRLECQPAYSCDFVDGVDRVDEERTVAGRPGRRDGAVYLNE